MLLTQEHYMYLSLVIFCLSFLGCEWNLLICLRLHFLTLFFFLKCSCLTYIWMWVRVYSFLKILQVHEKTLEKIERICWICICLINIGLRICDSSIDLEFEFSIFHSWPLLEFPVLIYELKPEALCLWWLLVLRRVLSTCIYAFFQFDLECLGSSMSSWITLVLFKVSLHWNCRTQ